MRNKGMRGKVYGLVRGRIPYTVLMKRGRVEREGRSRRRSSGLYPLT